MACLGNDITLWILMALMISALAAGFIDSVAGGGGLILVPSFILAGLPPQLALGQEKMVSTIGTIAAIYNFIRNKRVVWGAILTGIPFGLLGSYLGAKAILYFNPETIGKIILLMLPVGILLSFIPKKNKTDSSTTSPLHVNNMVLWVGIPLTIFIISFYDGFFGPGTGSFLILALHYLLRFDLVAASATSKLFNFSSNVGALIAFLISGNILFMLAIPLVICNILGNYIGSNSAMKYGPVMIKRVISLSLALLMCSLGYQFLFR
ncbi:sulfite exporter TauE/SafE family protein [Celerinatantimonas sp. YJH-8]|uniref:sulfite exporter TauE/SafE family protein n=1 Tax=Celerinatantimonas sp. YJH-8 TaxID=3228714 RepID=UPI0038C5EE92